MSAVGGKLERLILWDFRRASWQYDVVVALLLGFIFLTPRDWFRDQPRIPHSSNIAILNAEGGMDLFYIDADLLSGVTEKEQAGQLEKILAARTGKKQKVVRIQPIFDEVEKELKGYMAFTTP